MKKNMNNIYILGILMGIFLFAFSFLIYKNLYVKENFKSVDAKENKLVTAKVESVKEENKKDENEEIARLKEELKSKNEEITNLKKELESEGLKKDKNNEEYMNDSKAVTIELNEGMSNNEIADLLVKNNVYKYKNDLLLALELIRFNRSDFTKALESKGFIDTGSNLNYYLKTIEDRSSGISEILAEKGYVQDKKSFMKVIYLMNINTNIKYGSRVFQTNSSLRKVCDDLIS